MFILRVIRLLALSFAVLTLSSYAIGNRPPKYQIKTIVIDPGHGGHDSGCLGSTSKEKHIALAVSLKLGELIEKYFPDVRVIYTRKTDVFVELHERAAIANRNKADLFICVHCNAGPSSAFGAETFVMGLHKTDDNLAVARRENESALLEKDYQTNYEGYDPKSPEAHIIFSLYQNTYMEQSLAFASRVQHEFEHNSGRFNRGVKQAGFLVLYRTAMPSVLIELGFLTNNVDEKFLVSNDGQESMAGSIFRAFRDYKGDIERKAGGGEKPSKGGALETPTQPTIVKPVVDKTANSGSGVAAAQPVNEPKEPNSTPIQAEIQDSSSIDALIFTIQIGAMPVGESSKPSKFDRVKDGHILDGDDGLRRYFMGRFATIEQAQSQLGKAKELGFKDAFVCAVFKGRKISAKEAVQLPKTK